MCIRSVFSIVNSTSEFERAYHDHARASINLLTRRATCGPDVASFNAIESDNSIDERRVNRLEFPVLETRDQTATNLDAAIADTVS